MIRSAVFTINNPGDHVPTFNDSTMHYIGWARQRGLKKGTPHLQGLVVFKKKMRKRTIEIILMDSEERRCYIAPMRGTPEQARAYFVEDPKGTNEEDAEEYGTIPDDVEPEKINRRDEIFCAKEDIENGIVSCERDLYKNYTYLMTQGGTAMVLLKLLQYEQLSKPFPISDDVMNNLFNKEGPSLVARMLEYVEKPYTYRDYIWVVDSAGLGGKTTSMKALHNYVLKLEGKEKIWQPYYFKTGKSNDLLHMIPEETTLFLIDIPRDAPIPYKVIEQIRDGVLTSGKYEGRTKVLKEPRKMIVCSNAMPEREKITFGDFTLVQWPPIDDSKGVIVERPYVAPHFLPPTRPGGSAAPPATKTTTTKTMGLGESRREGEESKEPCAQDR
nr:Rep [Kummerowia striata CRESS virus]